MYYETVTPSQIERLYSRFTSLDRGDCGTLSREDFLRIPELAINPLVDRIVHAFFADSNDDRVNFRQFMQVLGHFRPIKKNKANVLNNRDEKLKCEYSFCGLFVVCFVFIYLFIFYKICFILFILFCTNQKTRKISFCDWDNKETVKFGKKSLYYTSIQNIMFFFVGPIVLFKQCSTFGLAFFFCRLIDECFLQRST